MVFAAIRATIIIVVNVGPKNVNKIIADIIKILIMPIKVKTGSFIFSHQSY